MSEEASKPTILLLEDESQLSATVSANLANEFEVETASTYEEAILLLNTHKFDVLLSDQMLPGKKQGLDFLAEAMRQQPDARRILVTGYLNPELLARGVPFAQLSACLVKPVDIDKLRATIRRALASPAET
ncbi:MAG TPA: response regulator [Candidatus Didemnitutus sp.]|nr:response regulator [Candidatus Didemnitutus sp.]